MEPSSINPASDIAVLIASKGRPGILKETLEGLSAQTLAPAVVMVAVVSPSDLPPDGQLPPLCRAVFSEKPGVSAQYNAGIRNLPPAVKFVTVMDDDTELVPDYLRLARELFVSRAEVVAFNGHLLRNGDVTRAEARELTRNWQPRTDFDRTFFVNRGDWGGLYGCNMNIRRSLFEQELFDERLPLYSLLFETDFGFRARKHGLVGDFIQCKAVHLQVQQGRVSETKLGFAQVMNLVYLWRKKVGAPASHVWRLIVRATAANLVWSVFPGRDRRKGVDRAGRLKGNFIAFSYLLRGDVRPEAIVTLK